VLGGRRGRPAPGRHGALRRRLFPFDSALRGGGDLASVPVERRPEDGPQVVERYSLDPNGIVEVLIRDEDSGYERAYRLGRV
jgi:hypothetical protein